MKEEMNNRVQMCLLYFLVIRTLAVVYNRHRFIGLIQFVYSSSEILKRSARMGHKSMVYQRSQITYCIVMPTDVNRLDELGSVNL